MQVRILGCSGTIAKGATTSFLLGERVLVDAGTGVGQLTLEEMQRIDHVFLTHSHLDHIAALPLMLDAVGEPPPAAGVHALPQTLAALHAHVFNDVIWPDFRAFRRLPHLSCGYRPGRRRCIRLRRHPDGGAARTP